VSRSTKVEPPKPRPSKAWAILAVNSGEPLLHTIRPTRLQAVAAFLVDGRQSWASSWAECRAAGWRAVRVTIAPEGGRP
jgi:hypothetical protein